jgi:hypothetical protein
MKLVLASTAFALLLCMAKSVGAGPTAYGVAVRDWKNPGVALAARLAFDLPGSRKGSFLRSAPTTSPSTGDPGDWIPGDLVVNVAITLDGPTALRVGEVETFTVEGEYRNPGATGATSVRVRLIPSGVVYAYQDLEGPLAFERTVAVWGTSGIYDASFRLTSRARLQTVPPNTISEAVLDGPPDHNSLRMHWRDAGNPDSLPTGFTWEVWEKRWWWTDILIAKGVLDPAGQSLIGVELIRGAPILAEPTRFFKHDHNYSLIIALKRMSPEYKKVYSPPVTLQFRYREVPTGFAERIVTPLGAQLGVGSSRELERIWRFHRLDAGRTPARDSQ